MEPTAEVIIYGASDDLVEVEGNILGADEFNVYDRPFVGTLTSPDGAQLLVRVEFMGRAGIDWKISVETTDGHYPTWPMHFAQRPDMEGDPALVLQVPLGTVLVEVPR